ncbi:hypothetical protein C2S52_016342 [Perilla frutescens var. hirtella]|nr:hypothetical protein C2S52_016342 [Perilla frutescens var. hirtella]
MKSAVILHLFSLLCLTSTMALAISLPLPLPGCQEKCGNVIIPYPFGIGSKCSANSSFTIICLQNSTNPPTPLLSSMNVEVVNISLYGVITVNQPVSPVNCSSERTVGSLPISFKGSPFTISARYNLLVILGCMNSVWLRADETTVGGCTALCDSNSTDTSCNGVNCCQTAIPIPLKQFEYTYKTTEASRNDSSCGYVFPVDKKWFEEGYKSYKGLFPDMSNPFNPKFGFAQLVLEWEFGELKGYSDGICRYADDYCLSYPYDSGERDIYLNDDCQRRHHQYYCNLYPTRDLCQLSAGRSFGYSHYLFSNYYRTYDDAEYMVYENYYVSSTKYCSCPPGYEGNPYLLEGCSDIDECNNQTILNRCRSLSQSCTNEKGGYTCEDKNAKHRTRVKIALISIGSGVGALVLLLVAWKSTKAIKKRIKANRRRKFFKRNGGLLLEQQLSATDNGLEKARLYSSKELTQATDNFNETRILGRGGQGTVYKGMLMDGRIVAIKKSKKVEEGDLEAFINEVVILSQVNHRNVVKLLGCCLETEVPLLVYEFVPNGTLLQQIHEPNEEFPLTWEMRVRIAREVAGALAYLHSSASAPIYHRDIKSTNILLDDKYRAKISDFGTSRSIAIDQTHLTTRVLGTFGYFDPEYFQSSQFTDKSDVYSFGVVMVELLTGEKAISSLRLELGRNLATHFVHSMEENQLFDIVDARVLREGKREEIERVAELARRCLHFSGKRRPMMKEVAAELEAIQEVEECSNVVQNCAGSSRECHSIEIAHESLDFSSTSESMYFDSITPFSPEADHPLLGEP